MSLIKNNEGMLPSQGGGTGTGLDADQTEILSHWTYDPITRRLISDKAIETTLNSLFLGEQHKMSSGSENIFFTNLSSDINFYPMWGGLKDQSITANQGSSGFIPPSGRIYSDMVSLQLGGEPNPLTSVGYDGDNYFGINITGLGITTIAAEEVAADVRLEYRIVINGRQVYMQVLPRSSSRSSAGSHIYAGDTIEWFFDHPVDVRAGTTIRASIYKVSNVDDSDLGVFQVRQGDTVDPDTGLLRYQATVHNRIFQDKDLELISPYLKYQAMDFSVESTGTSVLLKDITLPTDEQLLIPHPINTLQAVAIDTTIQIKVKGGKKVIIESLPVNAVTINGAYVNSVLNSAVAELNSLFTNTLSFASQGNPVLNVVLSDNNLTIILEDSTSFSVDITSLGVDTNRHVTSGEVVGTNLVLAMNDGLNPITIDVTNMINGSTSSVTESGWYYSYGTRANESVGNSISDLGLGIAAEAPFYFGTAVTRGSEFKWNANNNKANVLGIWDGAEARAGTFNSRSASNWSTAFSYNNGYIASSNVTLTTTTASNKYVPAHMAPLVIRFLNTGHLVLVDLSGATEVEIARTTNPLVETSINLQLGCDAQFIFPNSIVQDTDTLWEIVHDFDNSENGILDGIENHTVIKSAISIVKGEKMMFMLDETGNGDNFGTGYTHASTGVSAAEDQLENHFKYQTNEALVFTLSGANDWTMSTGADGYFFAANLHQYRNGGGSGTVQGMFSLRFNDDGKLTIYDEDAGHKVATATANPEVGSSVHLYMGVRGNRTYSKIPVISKQSLNAGSQPVLTFAPDVSDQAFSIEEGVAFNCQIALDANSDIVNMYGETDAPSWAVLSQTVGNLIGTAPAYTGSSDSYVIACKAGNAIGGITNFNVTLNVTDSGNTKSLQFDGSSTFLQGNATLMDVMDRNSNVSGTAWSIGMWIKTTSNSATQTLFNYGDADDSTGGAITIKKVDNNTLTLVYGSTYNNIITMAQVITPNTWQHIMVTYDGGTTGSDANALSDYYSRFNIYVDGVEATTVSVNSNQGYTGSISGEDVSNNIFRIGRANNVYNNYLEATINQVGIWASDESANAATIYNSGSIQDLNTLSVPPTHYYEIVDSVTTVTDINGSANLLGYNLSVSDLVTDTP